MRYKVLLREGEDGWVIAECPAIPGCITQGRTEEEAIANVRDAMVGCLAVLNEEAEQEATRVNGRIREVEVVV